MHHPQRKPIGKNATVTESGLYVRWSQKCKTDLPKRFISARSSVELNSSALRFDGRTLFLGAEPPFLRSPRWLARSSDLRHERGLQQHFAQPIQTFQLISFLIAVILRLDYQLALPSDSVSLLGAQSLLDLGRHRGVRGKIPAQDGLGRDFVHILTAWSPGAGKNEPQFVVRNANSIVDLKHRRTPHAPFRSLLTSIISA